MLYLLMAIAAMSLIMFALKFFNIKGICIPHAIMANYALAFLISAVSGREYITADHMQAMVSGDWWYLAIITGIFYFGSMDIMAASTRKAGVSVTTMASRTSVILPIIWAAAVLGEHITGWEILGTALVIAAFTLIIYRKDSASANNRRERTAQILLPIAVFLSVGLIAVCMKTSQHLIKSSGDYAVDYPLFETLLFAAATIGSATYYAARYGVRIFRFTLTGVAGGLCLGTFNYFVTLGIMNGLKYFSSSTFYGIYNIGVVVLATLVGATVFGERTDRRTLAGIGCAAAAIFVLGFLGGDL